MEGSGRSPLKTSRSFKRVPVPAQQGRGAFTGIRHAVGTPIHDAAQALTFALTGGHTADTPAARSTARRPVAGPQIARDGIKSGGWQGGGGSGQFGFRLRALCDDPLGSRIDHCPRTARSFEIRDILGTGPLWIILLSIYA